MAGRGPAPKAASTRARRNPAPQDRVIEVKPGEQPEIPETMPDGNPWPAPTVRWWRMWADHWLSKEFTEDTWAFLLDTLLIHGAYWSGDLKLGPELRNRVTQFGPTPESRARLRIQHAVADKSEREAAKGKPPAKKAATKKKPDPRRHLTSVQGGAS